jgi:hypothetical protein
MMIDKDVTPFDSGILLHLLETHKRSSPLLAIQSKRMLASLG